MENGSLDLSAIRERINTVDDQLKKLLLERLGIVSEVAEYKKRNGLPVRDSARERSIIARMTKGESERDARGITLFFSNLFEIAKSREVADMASSSGGGISDMIKATVEATPRLFPKSAVVACQGVEGAYSQLAAQKLFARPDIRYQKSFEDVLCAVDDGSVRYGVIPIENSLAGSVSGIFDMIGSHGDYIIRALRLHISHSLLAVKGTELSDIRRIYSHPQAISQCSAFLSTLKDVEIIPCSNTAVAAAKAAGSGHECAAVCSPECRELYELDHVAGAPKKIADNDNNHTRFVCVSKSPEIYPGADKMSMIVSLPHKPGSLYYLIAEFAAAGINLTKLESVPIPGCDFEYQFIFEFQASVYSDAELAVVNDITGRYNAKFLGAYSEMI